MDLGKAARVSRAERLCSMPSRYGLWDEGAEFVGRFSLTAVEGEGYN